MSTNAAAKELMEQELGKIEDGVEAQVSAAAKRIAKQRIQKDLKCMLNELDSVADALQIILNRVNTAHRKLEEII